MGMGLPHSGPTCRSGEGRGRWWRRPPSSFFMPLPVALHEVGHCLGLAHSRAYADVMGPYYVANNDRARARAALVK